MYEEDEVEIPIYLITGFLESGKTSFINFTVAQDYFQIDGPTLLITTEECEVEYDEKELLKHNTVLEIVEGPEQFTLDYLKKLNRKYRPERIILEYNPLWSVKKLEEMELPRGWGIVQEIVTVDASCFQIYMQNMKSIFMDMVRNADMVVFNRSKKEYPLANFRRSIKVVNPSAEVIFEDEEGEMTDIFADQMPFDLDAEIVDIPPEDYGIWFVDAMDHPDRYVGKTLRFKARARRPRGMGSKFFIPGRTAMTCCADDTSFLGYICKSAYAPKLKPGEWVEVTAKVAFENRSEYQGEGIVLYAENVTPCEPLADEMVYFN